jgi:hypothetical protein
MFRSRHREIAAALHRLQHLVDQLDRRMERIETMVMVREPQTPLAAEAYEGLRKQVVNAASSRMSHLSQLTRWDAAIRQGAGPHDLTDMLDGWFEQSGLTRVTDAAPAELDRYFEFIGTPTGGPVEVLDPAYVDSVTGRVVRLGRLRQLSRGHLRADEDRHE